MLRLRSIVAITTIAFAVVLAIPILSSEQRRNGVPIPLSRHPSLLQANHGVNFETLDAHAKSVMNKMSRGLDNYNNEKNTGTKHPHAASSSLTRKRAVGTPLLTFKKLFWYSSITIGTPPKSFYVAVDTASSDLVVPAATCHDANCEGHTRWEPTQSAHPVGEKCKINYIEASVSGEQYTDNVTIATFTANTQTLCAATQYSSQFAIDIYPPDGVIGMGFPATSAYGANSLFQTLVDEGTVANQVFSLYLDSEGGEMYIGGANHERYKGDFINTPVTMGKDFWQVKVENIIAKGNPVPGLNDIEATVDTASTFIIGDKLRINQLHIALGGKYRRKGFYTYPCDNFPDVKFTFNSKSFPISVSTHNLGPIKTGSSMCWSGIVASDLDTADSWTIGGVFLQNVYTLFDYGKRQIGFAELA